MSKSSPVKKFNTHSQSLFSVILSPGAWDPNLTSNSDAKHVTVASNKRREFEGKENQEPNPGSSPLKKYRTEDINRNLVAVREEHDELQALKAKFAELENSKKIAEARALEREKELENEKARATALEYEIKLQKAKKAAHKKDLQAEKAKTAILERKISMLEGTLPIHKEEKMEFEKKFEQVPSHMIVREMEQIFGYEKTDKSLTEIKLLEDGGLKLVILGRPPVAGASKYQFTHMIPYGLVKRMVKNTMQTKYAFNEKMDLLINDVLSLFNHDKGICVKKSELKSLGLEVTKVAARASLIYETCNDFYFLIENNYETMINDFSKQVQSEAAFIPRKQQYIKSKLIALKEAIHDQNTKHIFCEELINFIFILFNKKTLAAYPSEGNISESEIRLYDNAEAALTKGSKAYKSTTTYELQSLMAFGEDLNGRIRVVANSGSKVKEALKALGILDKIMEIIFEAENPQDKISEYNNKYNSQVKLSNSSPDLSTYNSELLATDVKTQIYYHIAKQAFDMFGLKALEDLVLAPSSHTSTIRGYATATRIKYTHYELKEGKTYRAEQKKAAKSKYSSFVSFRPEETDFKFLAEKCVDLISLLKLTYRNFQTGFLDSTTEESCPVMILKAFTNLIALDYKIADHDNFYKTQISPIIGDWREDHDLGYLSDIELSGEEYTNLSSIVD